MSNETLIGTLIVITVLILATCVPLLARALQRARAESLAPAPDFLPLEPAIEAPSIDPERLQFEESVQRMLGRYPVAMLDRSRLAGEIEHHWSQYLAGTSTWASAFANVEAWVRRQTQINKPLTPHAAQTLRDPRPHVSGSARRRQSLPEQLRELGNEVLHDCLDDAADAIETSASDRVAVAGVRDLIEGRITDPLPGTLAARVEAYATDRLRRALVQHGVLTPAQAHNTSTNPKAA